PTSTRPLPSFTLPRPPTSTFFPYTTLFRSDASVLSGLIMIFKRYRTSASLRALLAVLLLVLAAVPRIVNGETTVLSIDGYSGARVPWKLKRMVLKSENKDVGDLLRQLASSNELAIQVDERIKGTVSGTFSLDPQSIL